VSSIVPRLPAAFAGPTGAMPTRADNEAFRARVLLRIAAAAFGLTEDSPLPRDRRAFDALQKAGAPRIAAAFQVFAEALLPVAAELDRTLLALRNAAKHPSGRAAQLDIQAQLVQLFPEDLLEWVPLARLAQLPRYLKAAQARLTRAVTDPRKDGDKLAPFTPLWTAFLGRRTGARDKAAAEELRWAFEELRVAIFAPELKTPAPVSVAKVAAALAALR
jgi:ATP-dependent helicase HrpA